MKKKLSLVLALAFIAMLALSACNAGSSNSSPSSTPAPGSVEPAANKDLIVQLGPNPETLDPALNSAVDAGNYMIFIFEGLVIKDEQSHIQPGQAASWDITNDGTLYTFHLREGLKWSDGSPITAGDFVYSWQRVCDPVTAAPYADTVLAMVKGFDEAIESGDPTKLAVSAPDDHTLVAELTWNCPYFLGVCAFPTLYPVQRATVEANGDSWSTSAASYVSNGPFMVTEIVPSSHLLFAKNPNYHDAGRVKLDSIKCLLIENDAATLAAYRSGEAQMVKNLPAGEMDTLKSDPDYRLSPIQGTYYLDLNNQREPFTDWRVRMALSLAIDRQYVANTIMKGTYIPAPNFVGPGISDWDGSEFKDNANGGVPYIDINDHAGNLEKAKQLLAEAGYPNGEGLPEFTYSLNDAAYHKVVSEYLQNAWAELGVNMRIDVVEWSSFTPQRRAGDYDSARDGWVLDYDDPSNILELAETGNGNNNCKFSNPDYDAAMARSRVAKTYEERWAALHDAEDIVMGLAGVVPVAYYADFFMIQPSITGWWHSPDGFWHFEWADIAS